MPWTIAITGPDLAQPGLDVLSAAGCRVLFITDNSTDAELLALVRREKIDGILARQGVSGDAIRAADALRCISRHGAGYNSVDIPAATAKRIPVLVAAGVNAQSVAELTIGLMIAVARAIPTHDANLTARGGSRDRWAFSLAAAPWASSGWARWASAWRVPPPAWASR